jgi:hypothetical protein
MADRVSRQAEAAQDPESPSEMEEAMKTDRSERVLDACERVHMLYTGATPDVTVGELEHLDAFLADRLLTWQEPTNVSAPYDGIVRRLVERALVEVRLFRARRPDLFPPSRTVVSGSARSKMRREGLRAHLHAWPAIPGASLD